MKSGKFFTAALVAALLVQSAAIDATAAVVQSKKNRKASPRTTTAGVKSTSEQATDATPAASPTPAPSKANNRDTTAAGAPAASQSPAKAVTTSAKAEAASTTAARYFYEFKQPDFLISRVMIEHDAAGRGQISFVRKNSEEVFTDPLEIAPAALARIKAAWDALKFLDSDTSYQDEKQFPHLGTMTLRMREGTRERTAEFNWTHHEQAGALVKEYRGIGEQQLFIFDVTIARQYQPSDTIKIFKRLESLLDRKEISDTTQLVGLLRDLETDERIPLMARNHATRLLKKIEKVK
ncbi:MAG TPA: hypothetical protein VK363_14835 [Pyrinomonadaceae bacterium]|nr:hypothetical protein [Pyrinomonadaceae bacterium]